MLAVRLAIAVLLAGSTAAAQETGVLRVTVTIAGPNGTATPIPRVLLLVSDNPATAEPRRVRTGSDGALELTLRPGQYTVESDRPVALGGRLYVWTQMIDVAAGGRAELALSAANAEIEDDPGGAAGGDAPFRADSAALLQAWRSSVAEIWTPTAHATGFLIDRRGLIATNDKAIGDATVVHVQFAGAPPLKVAGRVIASDARQGVAIIWIDPAPVAALPLVEAACGEAAAVAMDDRVVAMIAPMLEPVSAVAGVVGRVDGRLFRADWRLGVGNAGGPVFAADGRPVGITVQAEESDRDRPAESPVVPLANVCGVLAVAERAIAGAAPPAAAVLRTEAGLPANPPRATADSKAPRPPALTSSDFDVTLLTTMTARDAPMSARTDFGIWTGYVANAPQALLVRVTPQFEESFWKTLARGAALTQGVALPPLKSHTSNFRSLRAFCGDAEVAPIRPLVVEREVPDRAALREGLYVFALTDFGPHCGAVRFDLFSEKAPDKADSLAVDPALFAQIGGAEALTRVPHEGS